MRAEYTYGVVGEHAVRATAVGDDLPVVGDLGEPVGQFVQRDADRAGDVPGGVLLGRAYVIGDVAHPAWRARAVDVYRLWRDSGYAIGALIAGVTADLLGLRAAVWVVAAITALSGLVVAVRMYETKSKPRYRVTDQGR
jgi:MFS family permease